MTVLMLLLVKRSQIGRHWIILVVQENKDQKSVDLWVLVALQFAGVEPIE